MLPPWFDCPFCRWPLRTWDSLMYTSGEPASSTVA